MYNNNFLSLKEMKLIQKMLINFEFSSILQIYMKKIFLQILGWQLLMGISVSRYWGAWCCSDCFIEQSYFNSSFSFIQIGICFFSKYFKWILNSIRIKLVYSNYQLSFIISATSAILWSILSIIKKYNKPNWLIIKN